MKKAVIAIVAGFALSLMSAPVASATVATSEPTVVQTKKSDYKKKDRNKYWRAVRREDRPMARIIGKKDVIGMGVVVCDLLRSGGDLYDLSEIAAEADPIIYDFVIVTMALAPVYLCTDQDYKFDD